MISAMQDIQFTLIQTVFLWAIPLLFAITLHEVAHGYMANQLGDSTASMLGRLTLNPVKHVDLIGTIILPILTIMIGGFVFGWAKPVPVNNRYFKHFKRDTALVAFAGPFANFLMVFLWAILAKTGDYFSTISPVGQSIGIVLQAMATIGMYVNSVLCILNLLPLPALDGGHIFSSLLPAKYSFYFDRALPYGMIILLILLASGLFIRLMNTPVNFLISVASMMVNL